MRYLPLLLALGCGPSWTASDATNATNSVRSWVLVRQLCAPDSIDTCKPSTLRALSTSAICPEASALGRHGEPIPDTGDLTCNPPKK